MTNLTIAFEAGANFISAREGETVLIRCNTGLTDCGETESLDDFVARHGGLQPTVQYLKHCYAGR